MSARRILLIVSLLVGLLALPALAWAQVLPLDAEGEGGATSQVVRTIIFLTTLAVVPALFITMTSFIRIAIVLSMVRHAFGMPETPPNIVLISLAFFLTVFVMGPTFGKINQDAVQPFLANEITLEETAEAGSVHIREFMLDHVKTDDIGLMYEMANAEAPDSPEDVSLLYLAPAFILNELRISFTIGFIVLLPFLLIDLVVSAILLSLGMMMVPPATISLPIKLLMFVIIDGWSLIIYGVVGGFG